MRFIHSTYTIYILSCCLYGCIDEAEFKVPDLIDPEPKEKVTTDIGTAINAFRQAETKIFTFDSDDIVILSAYVISSDMAGNFYKTLIIQDNPENPMNGLEIKIDMRSYYTKYNFGRKILLRLSGLSIQEENGKYIVGYLSGNSLVDIPESLLDHFIMRSPETAEIVPKPMTLESVSPSLINTFVTLEKVQFLKADLGKSFASEAYDKYNGERLIEQCDNLAKSYLYTSSYADFSSFLLPVEPFRLMAVLTSDYYSGEITLVLNNPEDIDVLDGERCDPIFFECPVIPITTNKKVVYYENFESLSSTRDIEKKGWENINVNFGNGRFKKRSRDENTFLQISAYNSKEYVMEVWLLSPAIDLADSQDELMTFDTRATFEEGSLLTCWISGDYKNNFKEANWRQLDVVISVGSRGDANEVFTNSGSVQLDCLEGNVRLAFRYLGSDPGASTTYDLDNILIIGDKTSE
jgi:hypothetical protein